MRVKLEFGVMDLNLMLVKSCPACGYEIKNITLVFFRIEHDLQLK